MEFSGIDAARLSVADAYALMTRIIGPRPIAWISTCDTVGRRNLAPYSYFNGVCSAPPILSVAIANRGDGSTKDTLRNIESTGEFVVNTVSYRLAQEMVETSGEFPPEINELALAGLSELPSLRVRPPRVAESPVQMECTLESIMRIGEGPHAGNLVLGRIAWVHLSQEVVDPQGRVDPARIDLIGRMGGRDYTRTLDRFVLERRLRDADRAR